MSAVRLVLLASVIGCNSTTDRTQQDAGSSRGAAAKGMMANRVGAVLLIVSVRVVACALELVLTSMDGCKGTSWRQR